MFWGACNLSEESIELIGNLIFIKYKPPSPLSPNRGGIGTLSQLSLMPASKPSLSFLLLQFELRAG